MVHVEALAALPVRAAADAAAPLRAAVYRDWSEAEARWQRLSGTGAGLAFQRTPWVRAWYRHFAGTDVEPLILFVEDAGADVLGLALALRQEGGRRIVTFADGGFTDYNAPLIGPGWSRVAEAGTLWTVLRAALPPADMLRLEKMPVTADGAPNPLVALPGVRPSRLIGNVLYVPGAWADWLRGQDRHFRKEIGRCRRVFDKNPGAAFRRYGPGPEAARVYAALQTLQAARIADLGLPYSLDTEPNRSFYQTVVDEGLRDGTAILTALTVGDEVVAALLGITDGRHYAMTRLATPGPRWSNCSPGRMVIERTMEMLHGEGYRAFDFTIGDYPYKRRIGATPLPMVELHRALSPRGWPEVAAVRLKRWARQQPVLQRWVQRWRDRQDPADE